MRQLKITKQITNRDSKSLERYLQEVSKVPMIAPEEEVELAKKIKTGDDEALGRLVKANLRFVISTAKQYQHHGLRLEDLINEGNAGLMEAAKRFDETRGFKFISYAVWWIRQSILKAIGEHSRLVRVPSNRINDIRKIAEAASHLEQEFEREATEDELSDMLQMNTSNIRNAASNSSKHVSMDAPLGNDDENSNMLSILEDNDTPDPSGDLMQESLNKEIELALSTIDDRDAEVIRLSFGLKGKDPMSIDDISDKFGISRNRVRQIKDKTIRKLRETENVDTLKSYLQ